MAPEKAVAATGEQQFRPEARLERSHSSSLLRRCVAPPAVRENECDLYQVTWRAGE